MNIICKFAPASQAWFSAVYQDLKATAPNSIMGNSRLDFGLLYKVD